MYLSTSMCMNTCKLKTEIGLPLISYDNLFTNYAFFFFTFVFVFGKFTTAGTKWGQNS